MMPARLFCKTGELTGSAFFIDREATIGRLDENNIPLQASYISGHHARIFFDEAEGRYFLEDLNSSNGTRLDGSRISEPTRLERLHVITFARKADFIFQVMAETSLPAFQPSTGAQDDAMDKTHIGEIFTPLPDISTADSGEVTKLRDPFSSLQPPDASGDVTHVRDPFVDLQAAKDFQDSGEKTTYLEAFTPMAALPTLPDDDEGSSVDGPAPPPPPPEESIDPGASQAQTPDVSYVLVVTMPDQSMIEFPLPEGSHVLGRDPAVDLAIPDSSVSRRHARVTVKGGTVTIEDLGSKNSTFYGGEKLLTEVEIQPERTIRLGLSIEANLKRS